jgi:hypothetical protein
MTSVPPDAGNPDPPPQHPITWVLLGAALVLVLGLAAVRMDYQPTTSRDYPSRAMLPGAEPVLLPPPPMDDEYLPCSDCHADEIPNPTPRKLEDEHDLMEFAHGDLWCLHCHGTDDDKQLHLADGTRVEFEESWRLCTQCHAKKRPDWRAGVHGKRTGHWRGPSEYRNCVECHNPHLPPFESLEPKPPPLRPEQITLTAMPVEEAAHE